MGEKYIVDCPTCGQPVDIKMMFLMAWEDDLQLISIGEPPKEWLMIGLGMCEWCLLKGEIPAVRIIYDIEPKDWLKAYLGGLKVMALKRGDVR